jgi:type I restriction enzyme S subunit
MKDSGVEWLGEIPTNWSVRRLKFLASINDEALSEKTDPQFDMIYVDIGGVDKIQGIQERQDYLFEISPSRARRIVRDGDVIISTVRTYLRAIAPIKAPECNQIVSTGFAVIRPTSRLKSDYAAYALRATHFVENIVANSTGVSYPAVEATKVASFSLAFPELMEQERIAAFLDKETEKIDKLTSRIREAITRLREYRTALISTAVTGKINVQNGIP